jgi:hypothetical protein
MRDNHLHTHHSYDSETDFRRLFESVRWRNCDVNPKQNILTYPTLTA